MINHAAATVYEPGSVFKVFTLAMGLDSGVATVDTKFDVHTPLVLPAARPSTTTTRAIPSCRCGRSSPTPPTSARRAWACWRAPTGMDHYFRGFGLFAAAPSELIESAHPLLPRKLSDNAVATMAFGHAISVSPLAIATGMSAILNGGVYRPLTLKKLAPGQAPAPGRRVIAPSTSRTMLNLMRANATDGTGRKADIPGYRVGGKTGTAEKAIGGHYERKKLVSPSPPSSPPTGRWTPTAISC